MRGGIFWPPAKELAERFGVDITTARRWRRGQNAPRAVYLLLAADLGALDGAWMGWTIRRGVLTSPEGFQATPTDIMALPFMRMQIESYQIEFRRINRMEEQPKTTDMSQLKLKKI